MIRRPRDAGPVAAIPALLLVLALAAGCGAPPADSPTASPMAGPTLPADPDPSRPLLVVEEAWGPVPVEGSTDPRAAVLYGDGTLVVAQPVPMLLTGRTTRLDRGAMEAAWASVAGAGLARDGSLDLEGLFDAGTTTFVVDDGAHTTRLSIYALGAGPADPASRFSPEEAALRANGVAALATIRSLSGAEPWVPPALLLFAAARDPAEVPARTVQWTLELDLATVAAGGGIGRFGWGCRLLEGASAAEVGALLVATPADATVEQDGAGFSVLARPIYPDEVGTVACPGGG